MDILACLRMFWKYLWVPHAAEHFKHAVERLNCKPFSKCPYQSLLFAGNTLCYEDLLEKADKVKMRVSRLTVLCNEIYRTINSVNTSFMNNIFKVKMFQRLLRDKYKPKLNISHSFYTSPHPHSLEWKKGGQFGERFKAFRDSNYIFYFVTLIWLTIYVQFERCCITCYFSIKLLVCFVLLRIFWIVFYFTNSLFSLFNSLYRS